MAITFDPVKRKRALAERELDFADAKRVFEGEKATIVDDRVEYGEDRFITAGRLDGRMVVIVWTPRSTDRHVISMRHCHAKEEIRWQREIDKQAEASLWKDADR